jgi:glycosyltransferase involved in cell wall biosynthesis
MPRFDVLFAGRLSEEKGILPLLRILSEHLPDLKLGIVGAGPQEETVRRIAAESPSISVLGAVSRDEVGRLIATSRMGVLPSICNEILPTFVLECFVRGKRCVLAEQESVRWLAEGDFLGVMAPLLDPKAFAATIRQALSWPAPAAGTLKRVQNLFSMDSFCSRLEAIAEEMEG